ncbi:p-hydroxybenzoic acid efflux pump subunit AaeB [Edwardsiella tarda]|uniref:p-hydroxybenzoic acid efflux pump subunit AaeB n=1 Tax=Edwardsiella tarda TaxID=636 RepID=UPI00351C820B
MHPLSIRLRFACKLTLAILMALLLGFAFGLSTPRWSALTAALVAAGPAFAAGGEPFAGAIRYRGWLRIIGTLIGCLCALLLMMIFIRAPLLMLLLCCLWAGVCTWLSSLVRIENAYAWGLSGYTTLIIVISCLTEPQFILQLALERCGEIVLGIVCAVLADTLLAPRSVKGEVDRVVGGLLLNHWQLLQRCVANDDRAALDRHWHTLMREGQALEGMRASLALESLRWQATCRRLTHLHTLTLSLITRACEICLQRERQPLPSCFQALISVPLTTPAEAYQRLKRLRRLLAAYGGSRVSPALIAWIAAASQLQWLSKGVVSAVPIGQQEAALLRQGAPGRPLRTTVGRHALINGVRTWLATTLGTLFWLWSGWQAGSGCMIMIAVVTSLAVRTPNPRMAAIDFLLGALLALPIGALYYLLILPATEQSLMLLCLSLGTLTFLCGMEVQKRRLGSLGTLASTLNILVLSNPMHFPLQSFLDNALGQVIGCALAWLVLLLVRDHSRVHTGRMVQRRLLCAALATLGAKGTRGNLLPALYRQLAMVLTLFPEDIARYRLALTLIVLRQSLHQAALPCDSARLQALRQAAVGLSASSTIRRALALRQVVRHLAAYAEAWDAAGREAAQIQPLRQLQRVLHRYRAVLLN